MIILGQEALTRPDGARVLGMARAIAESCGMVRPEWNGFNVLHRAASRVAGLDLGFLPGDGGRDVAGILRGAARGRSRYSTSSAPTSSILAIADRLS